MEIDRVIANLDTRTPHLSKVAAVPYPRDRDIATIIDAISQTVGTPSYNTVRDLFGVCVSEAVFNSEHSLDWARKLLEHYPKYCLFVAEAQLSQPSLEKVIQSVNEEHHQALSQFLGQFWRVCMDTIQSNPSLYSQRNYIDGLEAVYLKSDRLMPVNSEDIPTLLMLDEFRWYEENTDVPMICAEIKRKLLADIAQPPRQGATAKSPKF